MARRILIYLLYHDLVNKSLCRKILPSVYFVAAQKQQLLASSEPVHARYVYSDAREASIPIKRKRYLRGMFGYRTIRAGRYRIRLTALE